MSGVKRSWDTFKADLTEASQDNNNADLAKTGSVRSGDPQHPDPDTTRSAKDLEPELHSSGKPLSRNAKRRQAAKNKRLAALQARESRAAGAAHPEQSPQHTSANEDSQDSARPWTLVGKGKGKQRADNSSGNPSFQHVNAAQQQQPLELSDIQDLVLGLLAGKQPNSKFIKVENCNAVKRVVLVEVRGLTENFIKTPTEPSGRPFSHRQFTPDGDPIPNEEVLQPVESPQGSDDHDCTSDALGPDDYLPQPLDGETFADPFKLISRLFDKIWRVNTPGFRRGRGAYLVSKPLNVLLAVKKPSPKVQNKGAHWLKRRKGSTTKNEDEATATEESTANNGAAIGHNAAAGDETSSKKDSITNNESVIDAANEDKDDNTEIGAPLDTATSATGEDTGPTDAIPSDNKPTVKPDAVEHISDVAAQSLKLDKARAHNTGNASEDNSMSRKRKATEEAEHDKPFAVPIDQLIMSKDEMRAADIAVHPALLTTDLEKSHETALRTKRKRSAADGWVDAEIYSVESHEWDGNPENLENGFTVLALDCEMCGTAEDYMALTRISVTDWHGAKIMDELVKPPIAITDYRTEFSGITAKLIKPVTTTLQDIQARLLELFAPDSILVGHSLDSDLKALKMTHPRLVDTSHLYPSPHGPPIKQKLRTLVKSHLSYEIQQGNQGHDPFEDARGALDLARLKCANGTAYGLPPDTYTSIFKMLRDGPRPIKTAMIDWGDPTRQFGAYADVRVGCATDDEVVAGVRRALADEGATFVVARLRELSVARGEWTGSRHADAEAARAAEEAAMEGAVCSGSAVKDAAGRFVGRLAALEAGLPAGTALLVLSGGGDSHVLRELTARREEHERQVKTRRAGEVDVAWSSKDQKNEQAAWRRARTGIAFMAVS